MKISTEEVLHLAKLAQLALTPEEAQSCTSELHQILELFTVLAETDTSNTAALSHPLDIHSRLRVDEVSESVQRDELQKNAPLTRNGYYLVPKVVE